MIALAAACGSELHAAVAKGDVELLRAWTMRYGRSASVMTRRSVVSSLARISSRTRGVSSDGPAAASVDDPSIFRQASSDI